MSIKQNTESILLPPPPPPPPPPVEPIKRQLSEEYIDPVTGLLTSDDPDSFEGLPRLIRELALLRDLPQTGYAIELAARYRFFPPQANQAQAQQAPQAQAPQAQIP